MKNISEGERESDERETERVRELEVMLEVQSRNLELDYVFNLRSHCVPELSLVVHFDIMWTFE